MYQLLVTYLFKLIFLNNWSNLSVSKSIYPWKNSAVILNIHAHMPRNILKQSIDQCFPWILHSCQIRLNKNQPSHVMKNIFFHKEEEQHGSGGIKQVSWWTGWLSSSFSSSWAASPPSPSCRTSSPPSSSSAVSTPSAARASQWCFFSAGICIWNKNDNLSNGSNSSLTTDILWNYSENGGLGLRLRGGRTTWRGRRVQGLRGGEGLLRYTASVRGGGGRGGVFAGGSRPPWPPAGMPSNCPPNIVLSRLLHDSTPRPSPWLDIFYCSG